MKQEIIEYLRGTHQKQHSRAIKSIQPFVDYLNEKYTGYTLAHQLQMLHLGFESPPKCKSCNGFMHDFKKETCSYACRVELARISGAAAKALEKRINTNIAIYGGASPTTADSVKKKRLATMKSKYGALTSPLTRSKARERAAHLNERGRQTLLSRYNVTNAGQLPDHGVKCKATQLKNYGATHYKLAENFQTQLQQSKYDRWQMAMPASIKILSIDSGVESKPNDRFSIECSECNNTELIPYETLKWRISQTGTPCRTCSGVKRGSLKEETIANFISSLGVRVIRNDRLLLSGKELDIVCPDLKIAFEFCGLFWHNDLRIFT